jgi:hypothetical protein
VSGSLAPMTETVLIDRNPQPPSVGLPKDS